MLSPFPIDARRNGRESVRRVSHECDLFRGDIQHPRDQRPGTVLGRDPVEIVFEPFSETSSSCDLHCLDRGVGIGETAALFR